MKVQVSEDLCEGHGKCQQAAPEVFWLPENEDLSRVIVDDVPEELTPKVERAIRLCPRQAISWVEDT